MFADQSGFYLLLPTVVRTYYAPVGQTPVLYEERLSRDHLWAMSGITLEGKLLMMEQERAFKGPADVVRFVEHALRQIPGKLLVISGRAAPRSTAPRS